MKKLMVILITGLLYMSCTDSMEVPGDADRNNTEDVSVRLVITIPASTNICPDARNICDDRS